jgi:flagellar biosynthesis chaperone FliJ
VKRYRFSLESVLHVRRTQEETARQQLAAANMDLHRSRAALVTETERYRARTDAPGPCDMDSFRASRLGDERAAGCVAAAHQHVESTGLAASARRAEWSDAARQVAALERLDERRQNEWHTEFRRQEDVEVNDMVTARWSNRAAGVRT